MLFESDFEEQLLHWFATLGYEVLPAHQLDPKEEAYTEREGLEQVILQGRLDTALRHLNPTLSENGVHEALRQVLASTTADLHQANLDFHKLLVDGVAIEQPDETGKLRGVIVRLFDFENVEENDWVVTNQFVVEDRLYGTSQRRIPDVVVFVNGLPLAVFELKNPTNPQADVWAAFNQLQTYKKDIPSLFRTNCALVIADGVNAKIGSLTAGDSRFLGWRTGADGKVPKKAVDQAKILVEGVFTKIRFLDLIRNFITFEAEPGRIVKKLAAWHQFECVRAAVTKTLAATGPKGDHKIGVVWHTQGSGKSLTMLYLAGKLVQLPALKNPTLVVVTDRNDLDDQLFGTFAMGELLLRQKPVQIDARDKLRDALKTASGGIYFTTIQKFLPVDGKRAPAVSERDNVIVIADEAHRSQYGFEAKLDEKKGELKYGYAQHLRDALPNASFVGFTGTPIELKDADTRKVFGEYVSIYDIQQAVADKATVPIYYESRLARLDLPEDEKPKVDKKFEDVTEDEEIDEREALKRAWTALEELIGTPKRLALIAKDIVEHFEKRQTIIEGKAMVVCFSRRICVDLYAEIIKLRPEWDDADLNKGALKVVMTGSAADGPTFQRHVTSKTDRMLLGTRFKDAKDPLKLVLVRDMWLTGFDVPSMHTLYIDKPMRGHNLMQAIARVNRVFGNKPGGLVVDYIGVAPFLQEALETYTQSHGTGELKQDQKKAVELMMKNLEICQERFHGFDYQGFFTGTPQERLALLPPAREHILKLKELVPAGKKKEKNDGYDIFMEGVRNLTAAFALAMPHESCDEHREEVAFFQAVRAGLTKLESGSSPPSRSIDHAIRQIVSNAIVSDRVIDIFSAAGLEKPDISGIGILSEEFLEQVGKLPHKNLAAGVLERLLRDHIAGLKKKSAVRSQAFSEMLSEALGRLHNRAISTAEVINKLIELARKLREQDKKAVELNLQEDEFHFYEALAADDGAQKIMGDTQLANIAKELTVLVRKEATVDWTQKRAVQSRLRVLVKRVLKKNGYPPSKQPAAIELVLDQAAALGTEASSGTPTQTPEFDNADLPLPFTVEFFDSLVMSQESVFHRVKTRLDGIERAVALAVAVELGQLIQLGMGKDLIASLLGQVAGKPLSFGTWLDLAWRLAGAVSSNDSSPAARVARAFVTPDNKQSQLAKELVQVVEARNKIAHNTLPAEDSLKDLEVRLAGLWEKVCTVLSPLRGLTMASKAGVQEIGLDGKHKYRVRAHIGPVETFPVLHFDVAGQLEDKWCYLLASDGTKVPLWPVVACDVAKESKKPEIFMARTIHLDGKQPGELLSIMSDSKVKLISPGVV
jgi:type I restriction enzyme R subunit